MSPSFPKPDVPGDDTWLDDLLDATSDTQDIGNVFRPAAPAVKTGFAPPHSEPGYVPCPRRGSYHARFVLKKLGAYFDGSNKTWYVPVAQREAAFAACKQADKANMDLVADEVETLLQPQPEVLGTCWECGGPLGEYPKNVAGATWAGTAPKLKVGALVEEAYCGCVERGDGRRRHRPDFRARKW